MPNDDEYWMRWNKPDESRANPSTEGRSQANSNNVYPKAKYEQRAPEPSPLLKEYMINKGIPVK